MDKKNPVYLHNLTFGMDLLQKEMNDWWRKNFPDSGYIDNFLGLSEELGELSHALLKQRQGIRGTNEEHDLAAMDAVGDIFIFLVNFCNAKDWNIAEIIVNTWSEVSKRNWQKNKTDGKVDE